MDLSWIIFLAVIAIAYQPLFKRLYRKWKVARENKRAPSALLGVIYPTTKDKEDK